MVVCGFVGRASNHPAICQLSLLILKSGKIRPTFFLLRKLSQRRFSCIVLTEFTISTQLPSDWYACNLILFLEEKIEHCCQQNKSYCIQLCAWNSSKPKKRHSCSNHLSNVSHLGAFSDDYVLILIRRIDALFFRTGSINIDSVLR